MAVGLGGVGSGVVVVSHGIGYHFTYNFSGTCLQTVGPQERFQAGALALVLHQKFSTHWDDFVEDRAVHEMTHILPLFVKWAVVAVILNVAFCVLIHQVQTAALSSDYYKWSYGIAFTAMPIGGLIFFVYKMYKVFSRYVDRLQGPINETFPIGNVQAINYAEKLTTAYMIDRGNVGVRAAGLSVHPGEERRAEIQQIIGRQTEQRDLVLAEEISFCILARKILRVVLILVALGCIIWAGFHLRNHFRTIDSVGFGNELTRSIVTTAIVFVVLCVALWYATLFLKQKRSEKEASLTAPFHTPIFGLDAGNSLTLLN